MTLRSLAVAVAGVLAATGVWAQGGKTEVSYPSFKAGADLRVRQEYFEYIPYRPGGYARVVGSENPS